MTTNEPTRRFPRVPVRGTIRALLRRVSETDTLPVTLREVSEGGICVVLPGKPPDTGARVTVEMALWRQMLYLPANVVWSKVSGAPPTEMSGRSGGTAICGLKLHLEVTDPQTRRAFAGWVRNQAAAPRKQPLEGAQRPNSGVPASRDSEGQAPERTVAGTTPPPRVIGVVHESIGRTRPNPKPERPYDIDMTEMDTNVPVPEEAMEPEVQSETTRGQDLFDWLFRRGH